MRTPSRRRVLQVGITCGIVEWLNPSRLAIGTDLPASTQPAFKHPGLLSTEPDLARMKEKVLTGVEPWKAGWEKLIANRHAALKWKPRPTETIFRGKSKNVENYPQLYNDIAAAYASGLRWRISGEQAYADQAVAIMNGWSATLKTIGGSSDRFLASGIYGYEFANAAELLREYAGWAKSDFERFQTMMLDVFYSMNHDFLTRHNGAKIDHYWCNWDACNLASMLAIGVLCDRRDIYHEATEYFKTGKGNGAVAQAVGPIHPGGLGQFQESGRDQGHATMCVALLGAVCEMAWNQGDDLYGHDDNRFLKGAEYVAKYNLGMDVPFTPYKNSDVSQPEISAAGRGTPRPCWEMIYNHYVHRRGIPAPYCKRFAEQLRPEGGGGDYGPTSGGFDQLGYGTLAFTREPAEKGN